MEDNENFQKLLEEAASKLGEMLDSVQIIAVGHDGLTKMATLFSAGSGDYYSRFGAVKNWLIEHEQYTRTAAMMNQMNQAEENE